MKFPIVLALILVSAHYSIQEEEAVSDTGEGKPVQLPAFVSDSGEERPVQLPAREVEDEDDLTLRSAQENEVEEEEEEQGTPVQLPARDVDEEIAKRSQKAKKCSKKCVRNAACVKGKCRCRRGFRFNKGKKQCVRSRTLWLKVGRGQVCENENLTLKCSKGRVIRVFYSLYGRRNKRTCGGKGKPIKTIKCRSKNAGKIAKKSCEGRQTCRLSASNKVYGDPCKGTYKYLTVVYGCRKRCAKNAVFNGNTCKCKKGYKGQGFKKCIKSKRGRDLEEEQEEKRDVTDEGVDISENGLEMA